MTEICRKKYEISPLFEVVCEINFLGYRDDPTIPGYFYHSIKNDFPQIQKGIRYVLETESEESDKQPELKKMTSTRFFNTEETKFVQISDGVLIINFSGTEYHSYENFTENLVTVLKSYLEIATPEKIERLRLRYLNLIQLPYSPDKGINLAEHFNYYPAIREEYYNFKMQFEAPAHYPNHTVFVEFSSLPKTLSEEDERTDITNFLLDINSLTVDDNEASIENISDTLKQAHENVGRSFEKLLTNKTRKLFKEVEHETCSW